MEENKKHSGLPENFANWKHLLYAADVLSQLPSDRSSLKQLKELLNSLEVHFPRGLNPVGDFQAYAFRQFCKALSKTLEKI